MQTIVGRTIDSALYQGVDRIRALGVPVSPRGKDTLEIPEPVSTTYPPGFDCVLQDPLRDANPFFHLFEMLWILVGRDDVEFLTYFNSRMGEYSDNGKVFHAPYGQRLGLQYPLWDTRNQVGECVRILEQDPHSRQAVLQIWDKKLDLNVTSKDIPCNDLIFLKVRDGVLNITVCCRSNDMIWGAYGTNVVQFHHLHQYIASLLKVFVGTYTQISDSFHVYLDSPVWRRLLVREYSKPTPISKIPLVENSENFQEELNIFLCYVSDVQKNGLFPEFDYHYENSFFPYVCHPMLYLWESRVIPFQPETNEWLVAGAEWVRRRT